MQAQAAKAKTGPNATRADRGWPLRSIGCALVGYVEGRPIGFRICRCVALAAVGCRHPAGSAITRLRRGVSEVGGDRRWAPNRGSYEGRLLACRLGLGRRRCVAAGWAGAAVGSHAREIRSIGVTMRTGLDNEIVAQINRVRADHHLRSLTLGGALAAAAADHSREMAIDGYFAHASPDVVHLLGGGSYAPTRRARFRRWNVGETLLWVSYRRGRCCSRLARQVHHTARFC